jgi:hypothetical protein
VTLLMARARGFSAHAELLAGCPPELLGTEVPRYLEASKMTANVLRRDGLLSATPRTFRCARSTGPKPTKHGFIARANAGSIARMFKQREISGPFTPLPEGRSTLAFSW